MCLLRGEETNLELQVKLTRMDGSVYSCSTPVFVTTSNIIGIEVCSDQYQIDCTWEEIEKTFVIWVRVKKPLFSLDCIGDRLESETLTREEQLRLEQTGDSILRELLLMRKRCGRKIEHQQVELVVEWYASVFCAVCFIYNIMEL